MFRLLDKNRDNEINLGEFIEGYILFEEKIKTKKIKVEKMIEDINLDLDRYKKNLGKHQNERPIGNGITNESTLFVTVYEAKELVSSVIGACDPFVVLYFQNQKEQTQLKRSTNTPAWNEEFFFKLDSPEGAIKIEVHDQTMMGSKLLGSVSVNLNDLKDQEKKTGWFDLSLDGTSGNQGSIRLKLQCILSFVEYYTSKINQFQQAINFLSQNLEVLEYFVEKTESPFGIIFCGELDRIFKENILGQTDQILTQFEENRKKKDAEYRKERGSAFGEKVEMVIKETFKTNNIPWSKLTKVMMVTLVILSFISLLERSDFVNFFISVMIWMLFIYDKNNDVLKYLQNLIITIGASLGYDLIWIIIQYSRFWKGWTGDLELSLKRLTYFLCLANFAVKIVLISTLTALKNKKQRASTKEIPRFN